jgi:hypothetical protein
MTIFSRTELQQECEPDRWSARVPLLLQFLLGRIPLRRLSQTLIIILMLISPLSFSTDKVTNFTYECPVSTNCTINTSRRITLQRQLTPALLPLVSARSTRPALSRSTEPVVALHCFPSHCRAPPA